MPLSWEACAPPAGAVTPAISFSASVFLSDSKFLEIYIVCSPKFTVPSTAPNVYSTLPVLRSTFFFFYFLIFLKSGCNFQSLVCCKLNGSIFLSQCKWNNCVSYNQHYLAFEEIWWLPRECIPIIKSLQLLLFFCLNTEILLLMNGWVLKDYLWVAKQNNQLLFPPLVMGRISAFSPDIYLDVMHVGSSLGKECRIWDSSCKLLPAALVSADATFVNMTLYPDRCCQHLPCQGWCHISCPSSDQLPPLLSSFYTK